MATTSTQVITLGFTGDVEATLQYSAAANGASPGQSELVTLASGANTITKPAGGSTPVSLTVIPPTGNTTQITLKGVTGDTGVALHLTNPGVIPVAAGLSSLVLTAAAQIVGVRLIWA